MRNENLKGIINNALVNVLSINLNLDSTLNAGRIDRVTTSSL